VLDHEPEVAVKQVYAFASRKDKITDLESVAT
jgi:hypothetical protein